MELQRVHTIPQRSWLRTKRRPISPNVCCSTIAHQQNDASCRALPGAGEQSHLSRYYSETSPEVLVGHLTYRTMAYMTRLVNQTFLEQGLPIQDTWSDVLSMPSRSHNYSAATRAAAQEIVMGFMASKGAPQKDWALAFEQWRKALMWMLRNSFAFHLADDEAMIPFGTASRIQKRAVSFVKEAMKTEPAYQDVRDAVMVMVTVAEEMP